VHELDFPVRRHGEPKRRLQAPCLALRALLAGQVAAGARIARRLAGHALELSRQLELLGRAIARIGAARNLEAREQRGVERAALGLRIGSGRSADVGTFVPFQAQPLEVGQELVEKLSAAALDIGVLDAQNKASAGFARPETTEECGARIAEMQGAR